MTKSESKSFILRQLTEQDEDEFHLALKDWKTHPGYDLGPGYEPGMKFRDYLDLLSANERGELLRPGYVPMTLLTGFLGVKIAGQISIRHRLNDFLLNIGGHVGYGVLPRFRRRGVAKAMLCGSFPAIRSLGIFKALITCDDNNVGSVKTIESCGGVLENKVESGGTLPLKRRYWINIP